MQHLLLHVVMVIVAAVVVRCQTQSTNACEQARDSGTACAGPNRVVLQWYWNTTLLRCEPMVYGGCGGTDNRFASSQACEARCGPAVGMPVTPSQSPQSCSRANEEYTECGPPCAPTCNEPPPSMCVAACVVGCHCRTGFMRNKVTGDCVAPAQCPSTPVLPRQPDQCSKQNEVYRECGTACEPACDSPPLMACTLMCVQGCQCVDGFVRNKATGECVLKSACTGATLPNRRTCRTNEEYTDCGTCEQTCDTLNVSVVCDRQCRVGSCMCWKGFVRDAAGNCIAPSQCSREFCNQ